ncbi:MAG: TatD family hydrolase [Verrucomicrobiota bacterium]
MSTKLYDAHVHLADPAFDKHRAQVDADLETIGLGGAIVNGTCPDDWDTVFQVSASNPCYKAAIGLHPWKVNDAPAGWKSDFADRLDRGVELVGEIGLDKWIRGYDLERQIDAFSFQLGEATKRNLPVSIHCLKAIGPLMGLLREAALPQRGFHIHAYGGPLELIPELIELGAYFSFNAGQLRPDRPEVAERIRAVPPNRILIKTDAPAFKPLPEYEAFVLPEAEDEQEVNHPANLKMGYLAISQIRGVSLTTLAAQVEANFLSYFTEARES